MKTITEQIQEAIRVTGISCDLISESVTQEIRNTILARYCGNLESWPTWVWEHLADRATHIDENGWRLIGEFSPHDKVILVFNMHDCSSMFLINDGNDAVRLLEECLGFETYFTNQSVSYILIHNHHDCVVAGGGAKEWLEQRHGTM